MQLLGYIHKKRLVGVDFNWLWITAQFAAKMWKRDGWGVFEIVEMAENGETVGNLVPFSCTISQCCFKPIFIPRTLASLKHYKCVSPRKEYGGKDLRRKQEFCEHILATREPCLLWWTWNISFLSFSWKTNSSKRIGLLKCAVGKGDRVSSSKSDIACSQVLTFNPAAIMHMHISCIMRISWSYTYFGHAQCILSPPILLVAHHHSARYVHVW